MSDINAVVNSAASQQDQQDQTATAIKSQIQSIVSSMQVIDEEKENMKECLETLKNNHDIPPKVARQVANWLNNPEKMKEFESQQFEAEQLFAKITNRNP